MENRVGSLEARYIPAIQEILNEVIENSTAVYFYEPLDINLIKKWFQKKIEDGYPIIGIIDARDDLLAYGTFGPFRNWPAYQYTIEHSIYVHRDHRGKGLAKKLLTRLIQIAREHKYHNMIAGIDTTNIASKKLHQSFGFESCAYIKHAGYKFGKWLDLEFYQFLLDE